MDREIRHPVTIRSETEHDNRTSLAAGTQADHGPARFRSTPAGSAAGARAPTRAPDSAEMHDCLAMTVATYQANALLARVVLRTTL